jgi:hypothetical protein
MNAKRFTGVLVTLFAVAVVGCGQHDHAHHQDTGVGKKEAEKKGDHSGWWCAEHGIPEGECSACSTKLQKEYKAKGDWCKDHVEGGIAKSQCFICNPQMREEYAKKYRAKYGKEPPEPTENMAKKDDKKDENKDDKK